MTITSFKISRFWLCYFFIRLFYLFFTIYVFRRLTPLGDTGRYLWANVPFSLRLFHDSTYFMDFFGGRIGSFFGRDMLLSNIPAMLISFFTIRWVVEKLSLRKYVNNVLLIITLSLPTFSIWTSVWSKETFGLVFSAIIAVLIINFLNGNYKIKVIDIVGLYLCFLFRPHFLPFIFQGLVFIYIARNFMYHKPASQLGLAIIFFSINILFLFLIRGIINIYVEMLYTHFPADAGATRDNIFLEEYDFFRYLPWGMFISFFGPTLSEMIETPTHAIAGIESIFILLLFFYLSKHIYIRYLLKLRIPSLLTISYLIIFSGFLLVQYPLGIFNPGSAIRYRSRFIFLFILLLLYLYGQREKYYLIGKRLAHK